MQDSVERESIAERLNTDEVELVASEDTAEVSRILRDEQVDCLVVQAGATDLQPADLVEIFEQQAVTRQLPIVLYGSDGSDTLARWKRSDGMFALREARSLERLMDTVYFFLHRSVAGLSAEEAEGADWSQVVHPDDRGMTALGRRGGGDRLRPTV